MQNISTTKFTNDFIWNAFEKEKLNNQNEFESIMINIMNNKENTNSFESDSEITLEEFLNSQEYWASQQQLEGAQSIENNIIVKNPDELSNQLNESENDFSYKIFNVKTIKVWWENNPTSYMHVFINTTEVRKLEEMKAKNKCQKLMFASASHEFRTPLNAFMNSLTLIDITIGNLKEKVARIKDAKQVCEPFYPTLDKMITIGKISSKLLMNLVEDILDLAKFDANRFELNIGKFKLKEIVDEVNSMFMFQCQERKIDFKVRLRNSIYEKEYNSDAKRIKQILINLISNSLKFTMEGNIVLSIKENIRNNKCYLEFRVEDTGIGIKHEDIGKLFKLFGMIDSNRKIYNQSGTGIGLSISK